MYVLKIKNANKWDYFYVTGKKRHIKLLMDEKGSEIRDDLHNVNTKKSVNTSSLNVTGSGKRDIIAHFLKIELSSYWHRR